MSVPTHEEVPRRGGMEDMSVQDGTSDDGSFSDSDEGEIALLESAVSRPRSRSHRRDSSVRSSGRGRGRFCGATWLQVKEIVVETVPTLLLTTIGLLFTGELLDHVSHWKAMRRVDELIIMIPVVLNLKGNLEMNLSARLGTASNIGELDTQASRYGILVGNMALLQVQAALVSFAAASLAFVLGQIMPRPDSPSQVSEITARLLRIRSPHGVPKPHGPRRPKTGLAEFIMVVCTSMSSACLSSLLLGSFMCSLVLFCRKFSLNPDNIAPPIAACLGDLITLCIIGIVSTGLISFINTPLPLIICILLTITSIACAVWVRRNGFVRNLITQGWSPLLGAMVISTATGIILDLFVSRYSGFALLAVIISGLPGAVGAIAVSRLSTTLHALAADVALSAPIKHERAVQQPSLRLVAITLFTITVPIEIIFMTTLRSIGWLTLPFIFIAFSLVFFGIAVVASLYLARILTNFLWANGRDPDMYALPIHSSGVDLIGQLLLVLCFEIVSFLGAHVEVKALER